MDKVQSTIRSIPTHHRQNPTEIIYTLASKLELIYFIYFPTKLRIYY
jgi:hypothetical protein